MPRRVAVCLVAVFAVACGSAAPTGTGTGAAPPPTGAVPAPRPPTGLLVVTAGGSALIDGSADVPPTLDLRISASDPLAVTDVSAKLDGSSLDLHGDAIGGLV